MAPGKEKKQLLQHADPEDDEVSPELSPVDSAEEEESDGSGSVYDSEDDGAYYHHANDDDDDDFEDQGSSDDDEDRLERQRLEEDSDEDDIAISYEKVPRSWKIEVQRNSSTKRRAAGSDDDKKPAANAAASIPSAAAKLMHTDDLSSDDDDEEGTGNRIGRVPIHWYDEYDHIGYDVHGSKVEKSASASGAGGDRIDQALAMQDNRAQGKFVVHDVLNDTNVELSARQVQLIRRMQASAVAHPEHEANPDYVDYFSGVNPEISGINSNRYEPKARFQPSQWEKLQVERLLDRLARGKINMDYLTGKIKDMNDANRKGEEDPSKPFLLWTGDEEDELNMRKGPQHIAAPKREPPGHAESYIPPDEYLPTEEEKKQWEDMEVKDRPHGLLVPKKFPNLRSVGAYEHSVRETFERCLDLYLCPRVLKRRLNIDPESLVPRLPRANDLRPFPTAKCMEYKTPYDESDENAAGPPVIRCVTPSPNGQFMASGASDGFVRLWEVETGRLLQSWNLSKISTDLDVESAPAVASSEDAAVDAAPETDEGTTNIVKPVVRLEWNPNRSHHCLLAAVGKCVVVIATGTAGENDAEITAALLLSATQGGNVTNPLASKAVKWNALKQEANASAISSKSQGPLGPVCALQTNREVADVRWQAKGDYFVSVSPKAQASAVLIHQLSRGNSQRPFSKAKGEAQLACFHPNKPFLFVASQQHVRIYHLVKQCMVKRLISGCRWISSLDVHPTGDHLIVGSLDRRAIWFDLDLSSTPYKTLKYHERALRACRYHGRYPLMATASDDGVVHAFHSMVYSDLMRNPLIVPVKILRGHTVTKKLGVLALCFHPTQPWVFTAGADGRIFLYQDI